MSENQKRTYSVESYNPEWIKRFNEIKLTLEKIFKKKAVLIEHIGSTSVPGMKAKPLIDVLVVVTNIKECDIEKEKILLLGYGIHENLLAEKSLLFEKMNGNEKVENIHVFEIGSPRINRFIDTRDYLKTHPKRAKEYSEIKTKLKKQFPDNYLAYRREKDKFLEETWRLTQQWKHKRT